MNNKLINLQLTPTDAQNILVALDQAIRAGGAQTAKALLPLFERVSSAVEIANHETTAAADED